MRVKAQEALYNFLSVVQPKCWDVGLLFSVGEKQRKKKKTDRFIIESTAPDPLNWNGRPANPL